MSKRNLVREPDDGRIAQWLDERQRRLPPPDRGAVLGRALQQLPDTPQRRRWWRPRWLPFGFGATRSSALSKPRVEGRTTVMFSATRVAALVAIVALGGSLALVAGPLGPDAAGPDVPAIEAPGLEAASTFSGSTYVAIVESGEEVTIDGVDHMLGQVGQSTNLLEVDDPRLAGKQTFTQSAADYGGFGPTWGQMRIEDDDGAWVGDLSGVWHGGSSDLSGWLMGEGAYQGLLQYIDFETSGATVEFSGAIYPAETPPLELEISPTD